MTDQTTAPLPPEDAGLDALSERLDELAKREAEVAAREAELAKKISELTESLARSQADHANLLKRLEREKSETHFFVTGKTVSKVLPGIDTLERALSHVPENGKEDPWVQGVAAAHKTFLKGLETMDVRPFDSLGKVLDETRHEAVAHVPGEADKIVAEFEKGWTYGDRVLRHAKVAVGNGEQVENPAA